MLTYCSRYLFISFFTMIYWIDTRKPVTGMVAFYLLGSALVKHIKATLHVLAALAASRMLMTEKLLAIAAFGPQTCTCIS